MFTVSSPAAASPSTASAGSAASPTSCSPFMRCRRPFAGCSSTAWTQPSVAANSASSAIWPRLPSPPPSPNASARCAKARSSSTPSPRSADPNGCSPISPATPIEPPSPTPGSSTSPTTKSRSATRTIGKAGANASCASPRTSSSAAFSFTSCPTPSTASVTKASSPRATEAKSSRVCDHCSTSSPNRKRKRTRRRPQAARRKPKRPPSPAARIAAASCAASTASSPRPPAPFAATRHEDQNPHRPLFDDLLGLGPSPRRPASTTLDPSLPSSPMRPHKTPRRRLSRRSAPRIHPLATREACVEPSPKRRGRSSAPDRRRAFPIAANPTAASFNAAYMRSPFPPPQPVRRRPHITLQIQKAAETCESAAMASPRKRSSKS